MLNPDTINKIAAGEVIIRPVSVVKELVENAIDAKAKKITIHLEGGGKNMIMVRDNGTGIAYNDVPLAFKRHATSKISKLDDLQTIDSLGFRGEALSSIAAVSKVTIITRSINEEIGSISEFQNASLIHQRVTSFQKGTEIRIEDLFYNTPARRKHMEKDLKEELAIRDLLNKLVLSHPEVSFALVSRGKEIISTPGNSNLLKTIDLLYGQSVSDCLIPLNYENKPMILRGAIGNLQMMGKTSEDQIFFINNRYIKNRRLSEAFEDAYAGYIMKHQHPFGIIFIDLPGRMLDVNIHPAKTEIKILNESLICLLFKQGIRDHLKRANLIVDLAKDREANQPKCALNEDSKPFIPDFEKKHFSHQSNDNFSKKSEFLNERDKEEPIFIDIASFDNQNDPIPNKTENHSSHLNHKPGPDFLRMKIIGQLFNVYILLEDEDEIYLIDQHAAHEAFLSYEFERLFGNRETIPCQGLMTPIPLKFRPKDMPDIERNIPLFKEIGYDCDVFGSDALLVRSVPILLGQPLDVEFLKIFILEDGTKDFEKWDSNNPLSRELKDRLIMAACKAAIKGGQSLHQFEIKELLKRLMTLDNPFTCPHGRPIILKLKEYELMKLFKRVV